MADWKNVKKGETYHGPTDQTVIECITQYGSRKSCSYRELLKTFGEINKKRLDDQLMRMVRENMLETVSSIPNEIIYFIKKL